MQAQAGFIADIKCEIEKAEKMVEEISEKYKGGGDIANLMLPLFCQISRINSDIVYAIEVAKARKKVYLDDVLQNSDVAYIVEAAKIKNKVYVDILGNNTVMKFLQRLLKIYDDIQKISLNLDKSIPSHQIISEITSLIEKKRVELYQFCLSEYEQKKRAGLEAIKEIMKSWFYLIANKKKKEAELKNLFYPEG